MGRLRTLDYIPRNVIVLVNPELIYTFAVSNIKDLHDSRVLLAENTQDKVGIYITISDATNKFQLDVVDMEPELSGKTVLSSWPIEDDSSCVDTFWELVYTTLGDYEEDESDHPPVSLEDKSGEELDEIQEKIEDRAYELEDAFRDFLEVATGISSLSPDNDDSDFADMLHDVLSCIAQDHGYSVYSPVIEDNMLIEYPYNSCEE